MPNPANIKTLLAALLLSATAHAELTWETHQLRMTAAAGTGEIATAFVFRNTGPAPVTLTSITTDCGCTTAEAAKPTYAPGETGRIEVLFKPGERVALQRKTITVTAGAEPPVGLQLLVNLIEPATCTPGELFWTKTSGRVEQSAEIAATESWSIATISATGEVVDRQLKLRIDPLEPGRRYRVSLRPMALEAEMDIPVVLHVEFTDGSSRLLTLHAKTQRE